MVIIKGILDSLAGECLDFVLWHYLIATIGFLILWTSLYMLFCRLQPDFVKSWHCRVVTTLHSIVICSLCVWIIFVEGSQPFHHMSHGRASTHLMQWTFAISLGYFLFDLSWCIFHKSEGPVMMFHHFCSILGITMSLYTGRWGLELCTTVLLLEITNPLLQMRWFLRKSGRGDTQMATFVNLLFVFLFGVNRIGISSYFVVGYFSNPRTDFLGRLGGGTMYAIGWVFWIQICLYVFRNVRRSGKRRQENGSPLNGVNGCQIHALGDSKKRK